MTIPVIVLAGQSNVGFLENPIEDAFDEKYGVGNYELVKVFAPGAPITRERDGQDDWSSPDELRQELTFETVNALMEDDDRVFGGLIWVQGEADTFFSNDAEEYGESLETLLDDFRDDVASVVGGSDLGIEDAQVTILELSNNAPDAPDRAGWETVIAEQRDVADADDAVQTVDPDTVAQAAGINTSEMFVDGLHYAAEFADILAAELVATLDSAPQDPGDDTVDGDISVPLLPVVDDVTGDSEVATDPMEEDGADDGSGFEGILFLLPLLPILGLLAGAG